MHGTTSSVRDLESGQNEAEISILSVLWITGLVVPEGLNITIGAEPRRIIDLLNLPVVSAPDIHSND